MLSKALNNPKKWGWLLEPTKDPANQEISLDEMMTIMGRSSQKHAYKSSLFQFDDLYMYQTPKVADILHEKPKKKKKHKKK